MTEEKVAKRKIRRKIKVGDEFGRWTVLENVGIIKACTHFKCKCDCGTIRSVKGGNLRDGRTKSCGCLDLERKTKHGMFGTPTYNVWINIIQRCTNPKSPVYSYYGGRGITICSEWKNSFEVFFRDMGIRPNGLTIERKDNELGYYKENCKWANRVEQSINQRVSRCSKTGVSGVYWNKKVRRYQVSITSNTKRYYIGIFKDLDKAKAARIAAEKKYRK